MPGAQCARSRACSVESTRVSHRRSPESPGIPARNGFNGYFVLSPVIGLVCHRHLARLLARLDASVEASGPHDFAVRASTVRLTVLPASTASRSASVTCATPLCGTGRCDSVK
jgi:hypothetical protein